MKLNPTDQWGTPLLILNLVQSTLGSIDLDPCSEAKHSFRITSNTRYTVEDDGLQQGWKGKVYMNPPYSNPKPWVNKFFSEYEDGNIEAGIALLPASTDTQWFSEIWKRASSICFWYGRIKFLDISDDYKVKSPASKGSVLVYCGENIRKFGQTFWPFGEIISRSNKYYPLFELNSLSS